MNIFVLKALNSRKYLGIYTAVAFTLLMVGCDRNSDNGSPLLDDSGDAVVVAPAQENIFGINVVIIDETGVAIPEATLLVINDAESGDIIPDDSETQIVENGFARLSLNTFTDSAVIRLEAEKVGFFSNGGRYELTTNSNLNVEIVLTSETADTSGIRISEASGNLSEGNLTASSASAEDSEQILTTVMVPQDLEILDVEGNPLNDDLRMSVVHYDSTDESALSAFPGGFSVVIENIDEIDTPAIEGTVPSESTEPVDSGVVFQSAGFTAIEIFDSEGNKADKFVGEIDVTMAIPPNTLNPETRNPIAIGDIIPVWSFDTDTAAWVFEGKEAVQTDGRGGLQVTYKADHLSYWNLDFFTTQTCDPVLNVDVQDNNGQTVTDSPLNVTILGADANVGYRNNKTLGSGNIQLFLVPASFPVTISFQSAVPGLNIQNISRNGAPYANESFELCGGSSFTIVTDQTIEDIMELSEINYEVRANAQCDNTQNVSTVPLENISINYYSSDLETNLNATTNANGIAQISGQGDSTGEIYATYNGTSRSQPIDGGTGSVEFIFPTRCQVTTGASGQ